jgi:hypothetical protein
MTVISEPSLVEPQRLVWESHAVNSRYPLRRALAVAGVLLALAFAIPRIATHMPYQRLGVSLTWDDEGVSRVQEVVGPPSLGLLRPGDVLMTMNGEPMSRPQPSTSSARLSLPKESITFEVLREGRLLNVLVPPVKLTLWQRMRYFLFRLAALIAAPLVAIALVWRRPDLGTGLVFLWYAGLQAIAMVYQIYRFPELEPTGVLRAWMGLYGWLVCWAPAAFLHFMAVFPRPRWQPELRWRSVWFWLVVVSYLVPVGFVLRLYQTGRMPELPFMIFESGALLLGVVSLVERFGFPGRADWQPAKSQRVLGLSVAFMYVAAGFLGWWLEGDRANTLFQFPAVRVLVTIIGIGMLLTPFALAYLMARDPAFDPRRILERSIPWALLSGVLAAVYLSVVFLGQGLFSAWTGEEAVAFNVVAALVIAFVFAPAKEALQRWLDRLFRRDPRALRFALDQAGRELLGALDKDEVRASVEAGITRGLGRRVTLDWPDLGGPQVAAGEELSEDARAAVENLLVQARIRLENLGLQEQRGAAERRALELREMATRAELRALHAQVQPHFLFNALNALSYLTEVDPKAAQRFTERLADMLRYTVQASDRPAVLLSDEVGFVEDYLGVARERYEGDLRFAYEGAPELLSATVPPLLLQPLVENSLKHGFSSERRALSLVLDAVSSDGWLTLTFTDDGCNGNQGVRGLGVGLDNLEQRIRRFGGPEASVRSGPGGNGGFRVVMKWKQNAQTMGAA